MKAYAAPTLQLMWLYFETQADKIHTETTLDKPTIIYDVRASARATWADIATQ